MCQVGSFHMAVVNIFCGTPLTKHPPLGTHCAAFGMLCLLVTLQEGGLGQSSLYLKCGQHRRRAVCCFSPIVKAELSMHSLLLRRAHVCKICRVPENHMPCLDSHAGHLFFTTPRAGTQARCMIYSCAIELTRQCLSPKLTQAHTCICLELIVDTHV